LSNIDYAAFTEQGKLNWPLILGLAVIKLFDALTQEEGFQSPQKVREASLAVLNAIPTSWVSDDSQFAADMKRVIIYEKLDRRREWCTRKVGKAICIHLNDGTDCPQCEKFEGCHEREERIEPWRLFHSAVDVFDRRNLISKPVFREILKGNKSQRKAKLSDALTKTSDEVESAEEVDTDE